MKYALLLAYQGKNYCGWQKQLGTDSGTIPSIQETIDAALTRIHGQPVHCVGSGRTDAGVHAIGQVAHFRCPKPEWKRDTLRLALNSVLPPDIRVSAVRPVVPEFHAQRDAIKKQYSYYFQQGTCASPFWVDRSLWIKRPLRIEEMQESIIALKGAHDFKPFQASGSVKMKTTVREILDVAIEVIPLEKPHSLVRFRVVGTGFLKQMIRGIAGTLIQIGEGRRSVKAFNEILKSMDRRKVGPTAAPRGLFLDQVWYKDLDFFDSTQ